MSEKKSPKDSICLEKLPDLSSKANILSRIVNLNVGEHIFSTTMGTLIKYDTRLKNILFDDQEEGIQKEEGWIRIDRDGKHFNKILNFLRDGSVALYETKEKLNELLIEAKFYQIEYLIRGIEAQLSFIKEKESGLSVLPVAFLSMYSEDDDDSPVELTEPEIRLTSKCDSLANLFKERGKLSPVFELFNSLCEAWSQEFVFTKRYLQAAKGSTSTFEWSFIINGDTFGKIEEEDEHDCLRMVNDFIHSSLKTIKTTKPSVKGPKSELCPIESDLSDLIKLNVGGMIFHSTRKCLTKYKSMLRAMFSGRHEAPADLEGCIRIDRSGDNFAMILDFLRDEKISLPKSKVKLYELLAEAEFYQLEELVSLIKEKLPSIERVIPGCPCKTFIIRSTDDEKVWKKSTLPSVKLKIWKTSRTHFHSDKLWRHILLFERFCCLSEGKVKFAQQIIDERSCLWTFSIGSEIVAEYDYFVGGNIRFDEYEIHQSMIKFLSKVLK